MKDRKDVRRIDGLLRRHFAEEVGRVRVPPAPAVDSRRTRRPVMDFMVRAAAAAVMAAAVAAMPAALQMETPLQAAVDRVAKDKALLRFVPGLERVRDDILHIWKGRKS